MPHLDPALTPRFLAALRAHRDRISPATLSRRLAGDHTEAMIWLFENPVFARAWAEDAEAAHERAVGDDSDGAGGNAASIP